MAKDDTQTRQNQEELELKKDKCRHKSNERSQVDHPKDQDTSGPPRQCDDPETVEEGTSYEAST